MLDLKAENHKKITFSHQSLCIIVPQLINSQWRTTYGSGWPKKPFESYEALSWCYATQFSWQLVSQHWRKQSIAICSRHVTRFFLGLQLACAMISKISPQSLQEVEHSSTLCNRCKPQKVARQVEERTCYTPQPTYNLSATPLRQKF